MPPGVERPGYRMFLRDLEMIASVGVHPHEKIRPQRIRVSIELRVQPRARSAPDTLESVLSYEDVANAVRSIVGQGHVHLIETLAERIAESCLAHQEVNWVRVRIEKPDIFPDIATVGIEIERS
ncbi:MAG TPA: dihydroneopterin aldolase [Alphaproteobacteria bacterium]|nr:dihydroneopterin aldolase [Alphaproteobacteria bacterium]